MEKDFKFVQRCFSELQSKPGTSRDRIIIPHVFYTSRSLHEGAILPGMPLENEIYDGRILVPYYVRKYDLWVLCVLDFEYERIEVFIPRRDNIDMIEEIVFNIVPIELDKYFGTSTSWTLHNPPCPVTQKGDSCLAVVLMARHVLASPRIQEEVTNVTRESLYAQISSQSAAAQSLQSVPPLRTIMLPPKPPLGKSRRYSNSNTLAFT
jgi:hypothetical protein